MDDSDTTKYEMFEIDICEPQPAICMTPTREYPAITIEQVVYAANLAGQELGDDIDVR